MPPRTSADVITQIRTMMTRVTDPEIVRQLQNLLDALNSSSIEAETAALAMEGLIRVYNDATDATRTLELGTERLIKTLLGVEQRTDGNVVDYVDGAQGLNYEWEGAAETTKSRRRAGLEIIRGIFIRNESTTAADIVYVAFDQTATTSTGIAIPGASANAGPNEFYSNWPLE